MGLSYQHILNQTLTLYQQKEYQAAYDYITSHQEDDYVNKAQLYNFRYSLLAKLGKVDQALDILKEAVIDRGYWYSPPILTDDDDLLPLQEHQVFKECLNLCRERETKAKEKSAIKVIKQDTDQPNQLVILHGNQENATVALHNWNIPLFKNYAKYVIQSDQIDFSDGYHWEDLSHSNKMLQRAFTEEIPNQITFIGAFSAGCGALLDLLLTTSLSCESIILVAPWLPNLKAISDQITQLSGYRFITIVGEDDDDCYDHANTFNELLKQANIAFDTISIPALGHAFPDNFNALLSERLSGN